MRIKIKYFDDKNNEKKEKEIEIIGNEISIIEQKETSDDNCCDEDDDGDVFEDDDDDDDVFEDDDDDDDDFEDDDDDDDDFEDDDDDDDDFEDDDDDDDDFEDDDDDDDDFEDDDSLRADFSINEQDCVFIMVDMQEKLLSKMEDRELLIKNTSILNKIAMKLNIPLIITEQAPEKLGQTDGAVISSQDYHKKFSKTLFSVCTNDIMQYLEDLNNSVIIIYGIESHVCVLQSCLDLNRKEFKRVLLVTDATSSRTKDNKKVALDICRRCGIELITTEILLFMLLKDANHPYFKELSSLIK